MNTGLFPVPPVGTREVRGGETILVVRRAKTPKRCESEVADRWIGHTECGRLIAVGDAYLDAVAPPWHTFSPDPGRWVHTAICDLHPVFWPKVAA